MSKKHTGMFYLYRTEVRSGEKVKRYVTGRYSDGHSGLILCSFHHKPENAVKFATEDGAKMYLTFNDSTGIKLARFPT